MAKKPTTKKKAAPVITAKEQLAREQHASMARAVKLARHEKSLMRQLGKLRERNMLDGLSLAAAIANGAGYKLERISAGS